MFDGSQKIANREVDLAGVNLGARTINRSDRSGNRGREGTGRFGGPFPAPRRQLRGFPDAVPDRPKTPRSDSGGLRKRWRDADGKIYEWDYRHGTVEVYDRRGRHLGEFDPLTGDPLKGPNLDYTVDP
jgi:hypothetical protein